MSSKLPKQLPHLSPRRSGGESLKLSLKNESADNKAGNSSRGDRYQNNGDDDLVVVLEDDQRFDHTSDDRNLSPLSPNAQNRFASQGKRNKTKQRLGFTMYVQKDLRLAPLLE